MSGTPSPSMSHSNSKTGTTSSGAHLPLRSAMKHSSSSTPASGSRPTTPLPSSSTALRFSDAKFEGSLTPSTSAHISTFGTVSDYSGPGYTPKVSFDTLEKKSDDAMFSFTLQTKSEHYARSRQSRVFLCAASNDESGNDCLDWVLESLIQHSDELIVLRGFDEDELDTPASQDAVRQEAKELMHRVQERSLAMDPTRDISIIVEFVAGEITHTIERLIALYRPDSLIVGTRGQRSVLQTLGTALQLNKVGSVSRWCLSHSPVPVIVVRPERKMKKHFEKRKADPKRGAMFATEKSESPKG